jgi:hypothetical protein
VRPTLPPFAMPSVKNLKSARTEKRRLQINSLLEDFQVAILLRTACISGYTRHATRAAALTK